MAMKRPLPESEKRLCGGCGSSERWLLHYIRLRGTFQRLCTNCVLKNHPGLFCPVCLDAFDFDHPLPARERVMCVKCPSIAHLACANSPSFQCPPCSSSSAAAFSFFSNAALGRESAMAFVAAAKIAANSMKKAAAAARSDAERRVREAVSAKKRAREALEVLAFLVSKEKEEKDSKGGGGELNSGQKAKSEMMNPGAMQVLANLATSMATEGTNGVRPNQLQSNDREEGA
ncbi:uncharacterized protein LOC126791529 [Argentina anserina]|uniref:uncharacterized protein LOC126791529 n=1 Tax=Argentina anserina TaxID=57926 RepID=UPI00217620F0|nr:uncharacterized protein LOC126791529 [Potentilla anserina]